VAGLRSLGPHPEQLVLHGQLADLGAQAGEVFIAYIRRATADGGLAPS
jgi:hypothetical protein